MKRLKSMLILTLFSVLISGTEPAGAGSVGSKAKNQPSSEPFCSVVSDPNYHPSYAQDGGVAYFRSWHTINGESFDAFLKKYSLEFENEKSAELLEESEKDYYWDMSVNYGTPAKIEEQENKVKDAGKYYIRLDSTNKIVYTIRRHKNEYICKFYIICFHPGESDPVVCVSYCIQPRRMTKADPRINLLLPVDKELVN